MQKMATVNRDTEIANDFKSQGDSIITQLDKWYLAQPEAACIYYGEDNLSLNYGEFIRQCNQVANSFNRLGVSKGQRVSVFTKNSLVATTAMVAVWKIGAVYCPICTHYKGDLLAYIINDTAPSLIVMDSDFINELNDIDKEIPTNLSIVIYQVEASEKTLPSKLENIETCTWDQLLTGNDSHPSVGVSEDDTANIIYTSGTTGNPKGVVQTHKWIHNYCYLNIRRVLSSPDTPAIFYNDLPMYHVGGAIYNVVTALWCGVKLALWDRFSTSKFWSRIQTSGATHAIFIDVMMDWLMKNPPADIESDNSLSVVSMTPLPSNCIDVAKRFGIDFITTGYGSTELGLGFFGLIDVFPNNVKSDYVNRKSFINCHLDLADFCVVRGDSTIKKGFMGAPSPLMEVELIDAQGKNVTESQSGQGVFKPKIPGIILNAYFNKPELTTEALKNGWYYSPDIMHCDNRGNYYFEDRLEGFIRIRGENVSAYAIEQQLNKYPAIERSAVVGIPAEEGNEQEVVAFLITNEGQHIDRNDLEQWIRGALPNFMQPSYLRFVDNFPITNTFKVEKHKLQKRIIKELSR